ncbi:hypothetical protein BDW62DRAFT_174457 [Aspergillus aurantiobrunneus]
MFGALPIEITDIITRYLPSNTLIALLNASWPKTARSRQQPALWKQCIYQDVPWLWEANNVLQDQGLSPLLDWFSLANGRRVWRCCEYIAKRYYQRLERGDKEGVCKASFLPDWYLDKSEQ